MNIHRIKINMFLIKTIINYYFVTIIIDSRIIRNIVV